MHLKLVLEHPRKKNLKVKKKETKKQIKDGKVS